MKGPEFENLLAEISSLDNAYGQGTIDEEIYFGQREELLDRARAIAAEQESREAISQRADINPE